MIDHRDAIELAATSLDFALDDAYRQRLDEHLGACESCRLETAGLNRDAAALASLPDIAPPTWVRLALGRPHGPRRAVLLVAAALVLTLTVGVALAVGAVLRDRLEPAPRPSTPPTVPSISPSRAPSASAAAPSKSPSPSPTASPPGGPLPIAAPASFPLPAGSARFAPGPDSGVWVVVDHPAVGDLDVSTSTVGLLGRDGKPLSGWPIRFDGWTCGDDAPPHGLPVAIDGSLRLVCAEDMAAEGPRRHVALALGVDGQALPGWPVDLSTVGLDLPPVVVGDELRILASEIASTEGQASTEQAAAWWLVGVSASGEVRVGQRYEVADAAGNFDVRLAADGNAYRVAFSGEPGAVQTEVTAIDFDGKRSGWPVTVDGRASQPVVGPDGLLVLVTELGQGVGARAQTMSIDPAGGAATATSDGLPIAPLEDRTGAGSVVLSPIVGADGAIHVLGSDESRQRVFVVNPPLAGGGVAPARLAKPLQPMGVCSGQDIGCGVWRALPVVGPDGTLYVPESAVGEGGGLAASSGGSLVAISPDGSTPKGWPVFLPDTMAGFWSVVVRPDGTLLALAAIPQDPGPNLDLMVIGSNGKVLSTTHLVGE